ncbi:MAG: hypothetical protein NTY10_02720 [Candidatus Omnitrophica bacterium]|nr:hypothetical protein [Candidatus Omnitrophota bacterium]
MEWKSFGDNISVTGNPREVRSLKLPDALGNFRRYRVTTTWDLDRYAFTRSPAVGRLAKDKEGKIGAIVMGRSSGYLKIGRFPNRQTFLFVPLNSLSQKVKNGLLKNENLDLFTEGNFLFARQRSSEF